MKLLLDQNLSPRVRFLLTEMFEEIQHVRDLGHDEATDQEIWQVARKENWVLVSKDGDFADMALLYGAPPKVIRLRIGNGPWREAADVMLANADSIQRFLEDSTSSLLVLSSQRFC